MPPGTSLSQLLRPSVCSSCRQSMRKSQRAPLATFTRLLADEKPPANPSSTTTLPNDASKSTTAGKDAKDAIADILGSLKDMEGISIRSRNTISPRRSTQGLTDRISSTRGIVPPQRPGEMPIKPMTASQHGMHHLHIYAHKHNTHIVLTRPNREPILSYSAGNIGFRKAQRGSFDAAFQLAAYVMRTISDKGLLRSGRWSEATGTRKLEAPIHDLELVLRGFGKGRDAVVKALLGTEGRYLREKIKMVSDDTKLKFGGTRSPNPRRLG